MQHNNAHPSIQVNEKHIYGYNQMIVTEYGDKIKVTYFKKPIRLSGFEVHRTKLDEYNEYLKNGNWLRILPLAEVLTYESEDEFEKLFGSAEQENEKQKSEKKLQANIRRTKARIFELAMCNEWEYFCTFTIDGSKFKRDDIANFYKKFGKFLNNLKTKKGYKINYLLIPELHKDKTNWHMHGLMSGLPKEELSRFGAEAPKKIRDKNYLNWERYQRTFGFCSFDKIKSHEKVSNYITKYVTKELEKCVTELNAHMFYATKGLKGRTILQRGEVEILDFKNFDFDNEFVAVKWLDKSEAEEWCPHVLMGGGERI